MAYAALADLEERYGADELIELTDLAEPRTGAADPVMVGRALDDASNIIDGYIGSRYAVPLASVPDLVKTWCCQITRYRLFLHNPPERAVDDYKDALAQLRDVAAGRLALQVAGIAPDAPAGGGVRGSSAPRVFTRDSLKSGGFLS